MSELLGKENTEERRPGWSDERVDTVIGNLLRWGVSVSALIVLLGAARLLAQDGLRRSEDRSVFEPKPASPSSIVRQAVALDSRGLLMLGLLVLIATPVARVIFSIAVFALQRDWMYVCFTLLVLTVLLYSLLSGYFS